VLRFSAAAAQAPLAELGRLIAAAAVGDSDALAADKFIDAVEAMNRRLDIPSQLDSLQEADISAIAADAVKEGASYPVPVLMSRAECQDILRQLLPRAATAEALA
ncbi:MAG: iron-containing alcohol dehydrogenase, partial [Spongiibacter sp.]